MNAGAHAPTVAADAELSRSVVYRALARDAYLQVADNLVFRIMLVLVLVMVACTFVIGFRDDHIAILFGVTTIEYDTVIGGIGGFFGVIGTENRSATFVEQIQSSFATSIAGSFGALFSVVATSFFVPRMLEKGAADTLFSKPVTRGVLVLSRWFGAIVFVAILAVVLVFGMWAGFAVASGYTNPRFLWAAPMLIYQFALLSAISTFFGALTRSSIATLLLTVLSWWGCVAVHAVWLFLFEYMGAMEERGLVPPEAERYDEADGTSGEPRRVENAEPHPLVQFLDDAVTLGHYVLPKTGDAAELTELVRKTLHGENRTLLGGIEVRGQTLAVHERADGAIVVRSPEGNEALFEDGRGKLLEMDARRPVYVRVNDDGSIDAWTVSPRDARRNREAQAAPDAADPAQAAERPVELPAEAVPATIVSAEDVDFGITDPVTYYRTRFTWDQTDLGYSPQFSFFSSLGFSGLLLLLAVWRVRRIDF
jgi:ABC-type transport system involved in multi-copper enzyme maturation permease subunit